MKDKIEKLISIMSRKLQSGDMITWSPGGITVKQSEKINSCTLSIESYKFSKLAKELADEYSLDLGMSNNHGSLLAYRFVRRETEK